MKKLILFAVILSFCGLYAAEKPVIFVDYTNPPAAELLSPFPEVPVEPGKDYESNLLLHIHKAVPGAAVNSELVQIDPSGKEIARASCRRHHQNVVAENFDRLITVSLKTRPNAAKVRLEISYGGNPISFTVKNWDFKAVGKRELYKGIYDDFDPAPADRKETLQKMSKLLPATAWIEKRSGRPQLMVNGKVTVLNAYKGDADYRMFGESGCNVVLTFNCGRRLFRGVYWDKELFDFKTGKFDFTPIEDNLLRIYNANPNAKVIVAINVDPDNDFMEKHPENIILNSKGVRGKAGFTNFVGYNNDPFKAKERWAYSYNGESFQAYVENGIREMVRFLRNSPAGNIVIGFQFCGGHDGQFVQWEYGPFNGHFEYSEATHIALRKYLTEIYKTDEALQKAWGDPQVTLKNAVNPSVEEFKSQKYFDDKPGIGRKIADCRRFISIGTARMLNRFAKAAKAEWQRPCIVEAWYSTAIWAQPSRLALDELIKDNAVNMIGMVSYYAPYRKLGDIGASANSCIQALNLRNLAYIQEMDHRTWRTQRVLGASMNAVAFPANPEEFHHQLVRDGASVLAAGGQGFYLLDMFGSWYHDPDAQKSIRTIYNMNEHAVKYAGKYPAAKVAIFMDEATRLMSENVPSYVNNIWRTSGITPALHYLSDLTNPELPEYELYILYSPLTLNRKQLNTLKKLSDRPGKVLYIIGDAGRTSPDFTGTAGAIAELGMILKESSGNLSSYVVPVKNSDDPVLENISGVLECDGISVSKGKLNRRIQYGYAYINDPQAKILGTTERGTTPLFAAKTMPGGGKLYYCSRNGALTPQLIYNLAKEAEITPFSTPGNVVFAGNGIAAVHRTAGEVEIDLGYETTLIDPENGKVIGKMRKWKPQIPVGKTAVVCYLPETD